MRVQLNNPDRPIPFYLRKNTANFPPDPGQSLSAQIRKEGGVWQAAAGTVSDLGNGFYELLGHVNDRNTLGVVLVAISGPANDLIPATEYEVVNYDPFQPPPQPEPPPPPQTINFYGAGLSAAESQTLTDIRDILVRIATAERA